jgi:hypothetical protein
MPGCITYENHDHHHSHLIYCNTRHWTTINLPPWIIDTIRVFLQNQSNKIPTNQNHISLTHCYLKILSSSKKSTCPIMFLVKTWPRHCRACKLLTGSGGKGGGRGTSVSYRGRCQWKLRVSGGSSSMVQGDGSDWLAGAPQWPTDEKRMIEAQGVML